jgi:hypothetical protein
MSISQLKHWLHCVLTMGLQTILLHQCWQGDPSFYWIEANSLWILGSWLLKGTDCYNFVNSMMIQCGVCDMLLWQCCNIDEGAGTSKWRDTGRECSTWCSQLVASDLWHSIHCCCKLAFVNLFRHCRWKWLLICDICINPSFPRPSHFFE